MCVCVCVCVCVCARSVVPSSSQPHGLYSPPGSSVHRILQARILKERKERRKEGRKKEREVTQPCLTLCDPMDCSPPGSSVQGILQARILDWVAISSSRGSSPSRDRTWVSVSPARAGGFFSTAKMVSRGMPQGFSLTQQHVCFYDLLSDFTVLFCSQLSLLFSVIIIIASPSPCSWLVFYH